VLELPLAIDLSAWTDIDFWTGVLVLAGIYALVALGLQLNVGYTGITNFGQAAFMAIGAYTVAILTVKAGFSFWITVPLGIVAAMLFGLLIGLPSLRLRADYLAIVTLAMAEVVRLTAENARSLTGGTLGLSCDLSGVNCFDNQWRDISGSVIDWLEGLGWSDPPSLFPLLILTWVTVVLVVLGLKAITNTPWGRVLRAVREDEDAARALGKNTLAYKLQSLAISGAIGAIAGLFLALDLASVAPVSFEPLVTFFAYGVLVLGGLGSYWGVLLGSTILWALFEYTRFLNLPNAADEVALRYAIVGIVLILLMAFRPQGMFGKREEMVLGE
jgi:branched-chain amino acid transport system permease protein